MKQSQLFTKTQKDALKDEVSVNAQLLIRAGFVDKLMAGFYTFLPLGLRVMTKIENIIRDEMIKAIQSLPPWAIDVIRTMPAPTRGPGRPHLEEDGEDEDGE